MFGDISMKNKKSTLIFIICYIAYTSIYIARLNLSTASPEMMKAGVLTTAQLGILGSAFSVIYACGRLINGALSDKISPKIMVSVGLAFTGISNIVIGFFPPFIGVFVFWSINAFAQSMLWSSILCTVASLYDERIARKKTSFMVTSVATGNILGILISLLLTEYVGLKFAFIIPGLVTVFLGGVIIFALKDIKPLKAKEGKKHVSIFKLVSEQLVRTMIFPAVFHGVMKDNISLWMTVFFVEKYKINLASSGMFVLFVPIIGLLGRFLFPICYKICKSDEYKVSVIGFAVCIISSAVLCFFNVQPMLAMVCLGLIYAAVSVINTGVLSVFPIRFLTSGNVASVSGLMDFATYLGAGIASFIYGFTIEKFGFSALFSSWIGVSAVSVVILAFSIKKLNKKTV